jgi:dihydroorotate dehydrogenase electron transfer subunit
MIFLIKVKIETINLIAIEGLILYQELASVKSNKEVMQGVHRITIDSLELTSSAKPGQFVMITCDEEAGRLLRRPISIHQIEGTSVSFLVAIVGKGTEWLANRQPGEKISWVGPMGNGFKIDPRSRNLLLVAGGMGIAPLCFLAGEALTAGLAVKMLVGAKTSCQICPTPYIPLGTDIITATEDGTAGEKGMVTGLLSEYTGWADQVFVCGPLPMYKAIANQTDSPVKPVQVSLEVRMGCGLGFCYACTIKTRQGLKQVCKDGPVFNLQDVLWNELK